MTNTLKKDAFKKGLYFIPLGGANEIGMNLNVYVCDDQWLAVDFGVSFSDHGGVEVIMPDPAFLEKNQDKLLGLVATHGHEDHIGAIPYLWNRFKCPIYATPFTAELIKSKLREAGLEKRAKLHIVPLSGSINLGPFDIDLVNITHSILEPNLLAIKTPYGTVVHTADWKFDEAPQVGATTDMKALKALGKANPLAMVCDSTNVFEPVAAGSEAEVFLGLENIFKAHKAERLVFSCFASNLARVHSIASLAQKYGRRCVLVGRSLEKMTEAAQKCGYLLDLSAFVDLDNAGKIPRNKIVYITTGSQGEGRAALSRIAHGNHPKVVLEPGDYIVFSSRRIPGNEKKINELQNLLINHGYNVIFPNKVQKYGKLHVSGHPSQAELKSMYELIKPKIAIPVHGDAIHIKEHGVLAKSYGVKEVLQPHNGSVLQLAPKVGCLGQVPAGKLVLDGKEIVPEGSLVLRERYRMAIHGTAVVTLVFDEDEELELEPQLTLHGIIHTEDPARAERIVKVVTQAITDAVEEMPYSKREKDAAVEEAVSFAVRRALNQMLGKKPVTDVHIVR